MARGKDTSKHPGRGVSRHKFSGGGYVDVLRSPELQRELDEKKERQRADWERDQVDAADRYYSKIYDF